MVLMLPATFLLNKPLYKDLFKLLTFIVSDLTTSSVSDETCVSDNFDVLQCKACPHPSLLAVKHCDI